MIARFFAEGGFGMWIVLALGWVAIGLGIAYSVKADERLRLPAFASTVAVLAAGALFWWRGLETVAAVLDSVEPSMRAALEEQGRHEAARPIQLGAVLFVIAAGAVGAGELQRRRRNSR